MFKTLKSKIVIGAVSIGLVTVSGAAFASTNIGSNLQNWYNGIFKTSNESVAKDTAAYQKEKSSGLNKEYEILKRNELNEINGEKTIQVSNSAQAINDKSKKYINDTNIAKAEIVKGMDKQFEGIYSLANAKIADAGTKAINYANTDLAASTSATGNQAVKEAEASIDASAAKAKTELESAIKEAKINLQAQIDTKKDATKKEINQAVDMKIAELRVLITNKANELTTIEKNKIHQAAVAKQKAAEEELESVINGI